MDPKNNANPAAQDEEQNTSPQTATPQDAMPSLGDEPATPAAPTADTPASGPADAAPMVPDETAPPVTGTTDTAGDTPGAAAPTEDAGPSIASDPSVPAVSAEPTPVPPEQPITPPPLGDSSSMPADSSPANPVPPTAPTPTPGSDKKTIIILGTVAAILLIAIAVLYLM